VHPTFLYESCWNLLTLIVLYIYAGKQKVGSGKVTIGYFLSYGIGRFLIEGLRTDQLKIPGTMIPVSQALSACIVLLMISLIIYRRMKESKKPAI
jgi:phosphatidylglycerol:prolipoprotein diacylglycerol transferase